MRTSGMRTWLAAVLAALAALLIAVPAASAHSDLESSDPPDGATLAAPPAAISFTFNEDLLPQGNAITLTELATGTRLALGAVQVSGDTASVAWPEVSPAGGYRAAYRVVSADGHPIDGTITFEVLRAAGQVSGSPDASPSPADPAATSSASATSPAAEPGDTDDDVPVLWALVVGTIVLAGVAGATLLLRRGR